jgi:branched-chain amino acid transport system permease protein
MLGQVLLNGLVVGSGYALIAVGHTMIFGLMKLVNFSHGELYMLGAYFVFSWMHLTGMPYLPALALGVVIAFGFGAGIDRFLFKRIRGAHMDTSALLTIGMSLLFANLARIIWGAQPRNIPSDLKSSSFELLGIMITPSRLFVILLTMVAITALHLTLKHTRLGIAFRATFQNPEAALLVGIDVNRIYTMNTAIGTGLAALAGGMLGMVYGIEPSMGIRAVGIAWIVVVTGGAGSFVGAISIGYLLGLIENLGAAYVSTEYKDAIGFLLLIVVLLYRPQGLFGKATSRMAG